MAGGHEPDRRFSETEVRQLFNCSICSGFDVLALPDGASGASGAGGAGFF